jgi:transcriptional regulator with XRE-family HTH domain
MSERLRRRSTPSPYDRELCLIGARLRAARVRAGLSQEALAVKVQCSQQTISAYESGRILPRSIGVVALAAALGVEASKLCRADRRKAS